MENEPSLEKSSIKVYIRVRPLIEQELGSKEVVSVEEDNKTVNITSDSLSVMQTKFDCAFNQNQNQIEVFDKFIPHIEKIPDGYNMTVFAYGQTGSGKTYTMFGSDWETTISKNLNIKKQNTFFEDLTADENFAGLIPRTIYKLFEEIKAHEENEPKFSIYCSFLQIYNEKIYDLLQDFSKPKPLNLHESKVDGIFVEGLAEYALTNYIDCLELMKRGEKNRFIRQTSMNTKSSRSHTIFQILLESIHPDNRGMFKKARLNLCDLAGSEKVNKSEAMGDDHFRELKNINQSLTTLGKVIYSLSSSGKNLPAFRESKLTRLLQDSLTANTLTFIVGNISPSSNNIDETMNTLKFVERARHIVMKVKPIEFNGENMEVVHKLQKEIQYLKELLNMKRKGMNSDDIHGKLMSLQEENQKLKRNNTSINDMERLIQENRQMKMEIHKLQMVQYAESNFDSKSETSLLEENKQNIQESMIQRSSKNSSGFDFPSSSSYQSPRNRSSGNGNIRGSQYNSSQMNNSFARIGKGIVESESSKGFEYEIINKSEKKKEKQKILDKLEELERIQKFNEEKLMKDLEQLEKKNNQTRTSNTMSAPIKKKVFAPPVSSGQKRQTVNYEDKIKELEAKLFGR